MAVLLKHFSSTSIKESFRLAIIGSGPAGFYTAKKILKDLPCAHVDMYESLPTPYGLVRYGVAPDHPEVKNCIHTFDEVASDPRYCFYGNTTIGRDVLFTDLQQNYHATVLAYGASEDKSLEVPGEQLPGVFSARAFVGWYNGLPFHRELQVNLEDTETVVVIGQGNVALDVARMLLMPVDELAKTDITDYALEVLRNSRVRNVRIIGRRGPLQVSFTAKELREMMALKGVSFDMDNTLFRQELEKNADKLAKSRPLKRLMEILTKELSSRLQRSSQQKRWSLEFLRSPIEILGGMNKNRVQGIKFQKNRLEGPIENSRAIGTGELETIECEMVLRSIGYKSTALEGVPFDTRYGRVPNKFGKVIQGHDEVPGLYVSGWLKRGPIGVIATTMQDAYETADTIIGDLTNCKPMQQTEGEPRGFEGIKSILTSKGIRPLSFADWKTLESVEEEIGQRNGKPREKFGTIKEMLDVIEKHRSL